MTEDTYTRRLQELLRERQLVLFVGADLDRSVTGLPSRADLARSLAARHGLPATLSLAQVAQRVSRAGNRYEFTAFLRDELDTTGTSPSAFHRRLVQLVAEDGVSTIITTAYDSMLTLAFQQAGQPVNHIVTGSDAAFVAAARPTLLRLYGDLQRPETLVVTEDDHYGLWRDREKENLLDEVRAALRRYAVVFIGYNLADPDFNLLWREVLDRMGQFPRGGFALWPGLPEAEVGVWRDRHITVLAQDPLGLLSGAALSPEPSAAAGASDPLVPTAPQSQDGWDRARLRRMLSAAFSDGELVTFCFDYFPAVYEDFSSGMSKSQKIQRLLDHCVRTGSVADLVAHVEETNPYQYHRHKPD